MVTLYFAGRGAPMNRYVTVGLSIFAGAALLEVALLPAAVIGGAAMLVPAVLPKLRRGLRRTFEAVSERQVEPEAALANEARSAASQSGLVRFGVSQAVAKTVTFRVIVTSLDFTTNYIVLGEFAVAAGLSTFSLIVGPVFYFMHETMWNYLGPPSGAPVEVRPLPAAASPIVISRPLAKTITFRTIATVMDFTTNFVVIGDLATAAGLSAFGFVLGPFVYLGHEAAWDYLESPGRRLVNAQQQI
jgi:uncharacterized membrane protein